MSTNTKEYTLKKNGCFNSNHENVSAGIFGINLFFDKKDAVQVKYEMIRAASNDGGSVAETAKAFGFSRKSYYQIKEAFSYGGLAALMPKKTGPKGPYKLTAETLGFIDSCIADSQNMKVADISKRLESEKGVKVHPRTIYRHIQKKTALRPSGKPADNRENSR